jgi:hypothetical protein
VRCEVAACQAEDPERRTNPASVREPHELAGSPALPAAGGGVAKPN